MITASALVAAQALALSCVVEPPRNVSVNGETATSNVVGLPTEMNRWNFDLSLRPDKDMIHVDLVWPGDPIRAGTALAAFEIGPHDYSFVSIHPGPCLFTQTSCLFMYTLSQQRDGTADILIQPAALASEGEWSRPFQVFMKGRCRPKRAGA
jgi:hypothetical protein